VGRPRGGGGGPGRQHQPRLAPRRANTVYLCASIEDQQRLAPAFAGLLNDLVKQVFLRVAATGRPLDPPLLIVIDEAGNTPLRSLPQYASTLAGLGVLLVTI
jgi:type IV secretion system protein VirD4